MSENGCVVEMRGVSRHFGRLQALEDVSLHLPAGRVVGLLGANGSGKSTLLRHIVGLYPAQRGSVLTFGVPAERLGPAEMARLGYVHQEGELFEWMTVEEMLYFVSAYYPQWRPELQELYLREFGLDSAARVGALSPGERQKAAILLALCFEPELLILDEPAAALDPLARSKFLGLLLEFMQKPGRSVIISSHILSDVEKIVDHVLIMDRGKILLDCELDELREQYCRVKLTALPGRPLPEELGMPGIVERQGDGAQALLTLRGTSREEIEKQARQLKCEVEINGLCLDELYRLVISANTAKPAADLS